MRFAHPAFLWFLLALPAVLYYAFRFREGDLPALRLPSLNRTLPPGSRARPRGAVLALGALRALALLALVFALARPQKGLRSEELTAKATDILFCLDVSRSMLSVDFKPENRFQAAKQVMADFVRGRPHDRLGLVVFAQNAITQCPLTFDKAALLNVLDFLSVGVIPPDQTAIGIGIATAVNRLTLSEAKSKVIVLLTDGSSNAGSIDPLTAAKTAVPHGIRIYTVGAGSPEGGLVPVDDPVFGTRMIKTGNDLDEDLLLRIASETGGKYFRAKSSEGLKEVFKEIDALEKTDIKVKEFVDYEEMFLFPLAAALLFLFAELLLARTAFRTVP